MISGAAFPADGAHFAQAFLGDLRRLKALLEAASLTSISREQAQAKQVD